MNALREEESIICKLTMGLVELNRLFEYPNCTKESYFTGVNGKRDLFSKSEYDELGRIISCNRFSEDGELRDTISYTYPEKHIQIAEILDRNGDRDCITKKYNEEGKLIYESFQFGWDGTKDQLFIKYDENGLIQAISESENIIDEIHLDVGYQFENSDGKLSRIFEIDENDNPKTIVKMEEEGMIRRAIFYFQNEIDRIISFKKDAAGNVVEERNTKYDDLIITSDCKTITTYDEHGIKRKEIFEDMDLEKSQLCYLEAADYDEKGIEIKRVITDLEKKTSKINEVVFLEK